MSVISAESIKSNLDEVKERISLAAERAGRSPEEVKIIAVTKGHPVELVRNAHAVGLHWLGENRVGEGLRKMEAVADLKDLQWDMIGHIQSRKAKMVAPDYHWVHSVDRLKIARYLDRYAQEAERRLPILLECNMSGEESKYGFSLSDPASWTGWLDEANRIIEFPNLTIEGLMTMAPWQAEERVIRSAFGQLRRLREFLREQIPQVGWQHLSMGMSDDFEIAIEEGATLVRLGRALFGPRP